MAVMDAIADSMARIRNAQLVNRSSVILESSKFIESFLKIMLQEGYISGYEIQGKDQGFKFPKILVQIKYYDGSPVISEMQKVSTSGRRVYLGKNDIPRVKNGLGIVIVSTSKGMITDNQARELGVGGEIICKIF